jgi:hypothetical protein
MHILDFFCESMGLCAFHHSFETEISTADAFSLSVLKIVLIASSSQHRPGKTYIIRLILHLWRGTFVTNLN